MYLATVVLLMFVFPVASVAIELALEPAGLGLLALVGKWFVFWAIGMRLLIAGIWQVAKPEFTAQSIFDIADPAAAKIVKELGFANLAMGLVGLLSIANAGWIAPAALLGVVFLGLDGIQHVLNGKRSAKETIAMVSDLAIAAVLAVYLVSSLVRG